ncbi:antitoxin Xre/MbcA/ParS toxin-binding domain-containing protein [Ekhidna sp.]|uniref:antitoxin Xre/MbcA/ParS toxin-binding domain-containing protein n=1 Tax=Ekhidna sp. TaxID=2608089 RepID=UPI003CCC20B8
MRRYEESDVLSLASEPALSYGKRDVIEELLQFDGSDSLIVSGDILDEIPKITNLPVLEIAEILEISKPNYYRKRNEPKLELKTIDKLSSLLRLYQKGKEAFNGLEDFNRWLSQENLHFGNRLPRFFLKTEQGRRRLYQAIGRIEHGIYG